MQLHHVIRALRPGSDEVLCVEAERITGNPAARELVAQYGTVEAVCIANLTTDECRVLEREFRKRGGTALANPSGTEVLLMGPLLGLGELPSALRAWGPATELLGSELEKLLRGRAHVLLPWKCSGEMRGVGEDVLTVMHLPDEKVEHGKDFTMTVEQQRGGDESSHCTFTCDAVCLDGGARPGDEELSRIASSEAAIMLFSTERTALPQRLGQYLAQLEMVNARLGSLDRVAATVWDGEWDPEIELSRLGEFLSLGRPAGIHVHGSPGEVGDTALLGVLRGAAFVAVAGDSSGWSSWLRTHSRLLERWNHLA